MSNSLGITTDDKGRKQALEPCLEPCPIERGMRFLGVNERGRFSGISKMAPSVLMI